MTLTCLCRAKDCFFAGQNHKLNMKAFLFVVTLFLLAHAGSAQILKVDKGSVDSDSSGYFMGSMSLDFNLNNKSATASKNITYTGLDADGDLVYVGSRHAYMLINELTYYKTTGGALISSGYGHARVNFLRTNEVSYEVFSQIQYDNGRHMPLRLIEGGNLRFRLVSNAATKLYLGVGLMYEKENWSSLTDANVLIHKDMPKSTNYISYKHTINKEVRFNLIAYYQGGYDKASEVFRNRVSGQAVLSVKLSKLLALTTSFAMQYEDKPIIPINKIVYSLTNGFKLSF